MRYYGRLILFSAVALLAVLVTACSGAGGNAGNVLPTHKPSPTPSPTPTATATATPTARPTATPTPTASPTATPTATPAPDFITGNLQVGSNYVDFQTTGGTYEPAPGYGNFTVDSPPAPFSGYGVTSGESGQVQSLDEGTGPVTLPSAFITFNSGGSQYQLIATNIPAGDYAGPFNATANGSTTTFTFQVQGYIENTNTNSQVGNFDLTFSFVGQCPESTCFDDLPFDATYTATNS